MTGQKKGKEKVGPAKKSKVTQTQQGLPQSFKAVKKPRSSQESSKSSAAEKKLASARKTRSILAEREAQISFQKKELARQARNTERRAEQIRNKGIFYKGRWTRIEVKQPFIVKVEEGMEGTVDRPIVIDEDKENSHDLNGTKNNLKELRGTALGKGLGEAGTETRRRGGCGPDITASFDRRYPLIAEMVERRRLDEEDDAGSLCDFVTADEWSDGDDALIDG